MKIDIIICAYNAHKYIDIALSSIACQTIKNLIQVTIVNDGSNKNYDDIVTNYANKLNIKVLNLKKNHGLGYAKQVGLKKTHNEYFMYLDTDDKFKEDDSVEKLYNEVQKDSSLKLVCGKINRKGQNIHSHTFLHGKLFKRSHVDKYKIKNKNLYIYEDLCFVNAYECLLKKNEKKNIPDVIYCYNEGLNSDSITSTKKDTIKIVKSILYSYEYGYKLAKKNRTEHFIRKQSVFFFYLLACRITTPNIRKAFINEAEYTMYHKLCYNFYKKYKTYLEKYVVKGDREDWYDDFVRFLENR